MITQNGNELAPQNLYLIFYRGVYTDIQISGYGRHSSSNFVEVYTNGYSKEMNWVTILKV